MKENLRTRMTRLTFDRLNRELEAAEQLLHETSSGINEAFTSGGGWHDNAAFETAQRQKELDQNRVYVLRRILTDVEFINPREITSEVGVGNTVTVRFQGEEELEEVTLLGPYDSGTNKSWISIETPFARSLIGKRVGQEATYDVEERRFAIRVISIEKGDFD